jgi:hypothetical protein
VPTRRPRPAPLLHPLLHLLLLALALRTAGSALPQSPRGVTVRAPAGRLSLASGGGAALVGAGEWRGNHLYEAGPRVFAASRAEGLALSGELPPGASRALCVVDGRAVLEADDAAAAADAADAAAAAAAASPRPFSCDLSFLSRGGLHIAAAYAVHANGSVGGGVGGGSVGGGVSGGGGGGGGGGGDGATLLGAPAHFFIEAGADTGAAAEGRAGAASHGAAAQARLRASEAALRAATPGGVLGVYYTTYQQVVSQLYQNRSRDTGLPSVPMDGVVASGGALKLADSIWRYTPNASFPSWEGGLFMSQEPALGMYCFFRRRAGEDWGRYGMADCPEASRVLQAHAAELASAGFEFIAPDATNWDGDPRDASNGADLNQLRPTEVIAEEWANMRLAGAATPALSTYDQVNGGGVLYQWYLREFFNNETLDALGLILRNRDTPRVPGTDKVYIVADEPALNYSAVREIQRNGGRNDIVTPVMWSAPDASGNYEVRARGAR